MKQIESYIPEIRYFEDKHRSTARAVHEDLALVDIQNGYRILACRASRMQAGETFPQCCALPKEELRFLEYALPHSDCVALLGGAGVVLLFPALARETGLLLAVLPHASAASVCRALKHAEEPVLLSPATEKQTVGESDREEEEAEHLREIFFYTRRILHRDPTVGLWTQSLLIANFVGCRVDGIALPTRELSLASTDRAKLIAFLLCLFLTLRQKDGRLHAVCPLPDPATVPYTYQVSFEPLPDRKQPAADLTREAAALTFLSHPIFRGCSIRFVQNRLVVEAVLPQKAEESHPLFRNRKDLYCLLRIELGA